MSRDLQFLEAQMIGRRRKDVTDRERLADISHRKKCAKHKGRNHWANWERRQIAAAKRAAVEARTDKIKRRWQAYSDAARDYWRGLRADLPERPA